MFAHTDAPEPGDLWHRWRTMTDAPSERSRIRRLADNAAYDRPTIDAILDEGLLAHVGILADDGTPVVIPMVYARDGDHLLVHGSAASRLMRTIGPVCVTVTIVDGLVVARSLFESSMNYRSVVVHGVPEVLAGEDKVEALVRLSDRAIPGRVGHARGPDDKEVRATLVWRLSLAEAAAKVRTGPPDDPADDLALPFWGGVIPLRVVADEPRPDGLGVPVDVPDHLREIVRRRT
ncbi:MAG: Pyridoxamine 5-phosphate oxidase-related, FMN-binding protein [Ilumatobacteraceae bacterium]|nr:Pyridoxamine 5-phosphate oxidase-related, FMN-binding protein [Ilumatobacteraceae bacterium]